jgi:hypothetical protein
MTFSQLLERLHKQLSSRIITMMKIFYYLRFPLLLSVAAFPLLLSVAAFKPSDSPDVLIVNTIEKLVSNQAMIADSLAKLVAIDAAAATEILVAIHNSTAVDAAAAETSISNQAMIADSFAKLVAIHNSTAVVVAAAADATAESLVEIKEILASWTAYEIAAFVLALVSFVVGTFLYLWFNFKKEANNEKLSDIQTSAATVAEAVNKLVEANNEKLSAIQSSAATVAGAVNKMVEIAAAAAAAAATNGPSALSLNAASVDEAIPKTEFSRVEG